MDWTHAPSAKSNLPKNYLFTTSIFTQHPILQNKMCGSLPSLFKVECQLLMFISQYALHILYVVCKWRQFQSVTHCNTSRLNHLQSSSWECVWQVGEIQGKNRGGSYHGVHRCTTVQLYTLWPGCYLNLVVIIMG